MSDAMKRGQMGADLVKNRLHTTELHRCKPPRAARENWLTFIVARPPDDLFRQYMNLAEIDGPACGCPHALRRPAVQIRAVLYCQLGNYHEDAAILGACGDERPRYM